MLEILCSIVPDGNNINKVLSVLGFDNLNLNLYNLLSRYLVPNDVTTFLNTVCLCINKSIKKMYQKCNYFNHKLKP